MKSNFTDFLCGIKYFLLPNKERTKQPKVVLSPSLSFWWAPPKNNRKNIRLFIYYDVLKAPKTPDLPMGRIIIARKKEPRF